MRLLWSRKRDKFLSHVRLVCTCSHYVSLTAHLHTVNCVHNSDELPDRYKCLSAMSLSETVCLSDWSEKTTALGHRHPLSYSAPYLGVHVTIIVAPHLHLPSYLILLTKQDIIHKDAFILDMQCRWAANSSLNACKTICERQVINSEHKREQNKTEHHRFNTSYIFVTYCRLRENNGLLPQL